MRRGGAAHTGSAARRLHVDSAAALVFSPLGRFALSRAGFPRRAFALRLVGRLVGQPGAACHPRSPLLLRSQPVNGLIEPGQQVTWLDLVMASKARVEQQLGRARGF